VKEEQMSHETQRSIVQWADETFGRSNGRALVRRMLKEWHEFELALVDEVTEAEAAKELIDVHVCMVRWLSDLGIDFQAELDAKMAVNRKRKWRSNGDGTGHHVPEVEA
jgi:hypothetical protein